MKVAAPAEVANCEGANGRGVAKRDKAWRLGLAIKSMPGSLPVLMLLNHGDGGESGENALLVVERARIPWKTWRKRDAVEKD